MSTSWGTGSDVEDKALAAHLVRLIDVCEDSSYDLREECARGGGG